MKDNTFEYEFRWKSSDSSTVIVTGTFDDWKRSFSLERLDNETFSGKVRLPYDQKVLYKYIVDGCWKEKPGEPTEIDSAGNVNHVLIKYEAAARIQLENDIRRLTQFLSEYHPQAGPPQPADPEATSNDPFYTALSNIATLLTFQVDHHVLCVMGDFNDLKSLNFVYQASSSSELGRSTPPSQPGPSTSSSEKSPDRVDLLLVKNPFSPESTVASGGNLSLEPVRGDLNLVEVSPSSRSLEELARCAVPDKRGANQLSLLEHSQDVVAARFRRASDKFKARSQLREFFIRRCFNKLRLRLNTDTLVLREIDVVKVKEVLKNGQVVKEMVMVKKVRKFTHIIRHWCLQNSATPIGFEGARHTQDSPPPPDLKALLRSSGILPNGNIWEMTRQNVKQWGWSLVFLLERLAKITNLSKPSDQDFTKVSIYLEALIWIQFHGFSSAIVEEPTLRHNLYVAHVPGSPLWSNDPTLSAEAMNLRSNTPADAFRRFIRGITAWNRAILHLTKSRWIVAPEMSFTLRNLIAPLADSRGMTGLKELFEQTEGWKEEDYTNLVQNVQVPLFKGTIHCEALSLQLLYGVRQDSYDVQNEFLENFFKRCRPQIGISRKPCWMCGQLRDILFREYKPEIGATHGIIFPWNPPRGLPINALQELRTKLFVKFQIAVKLEKDPSKSQLSSPTLSMERPESPPAHGDPIEDDDGYSFEMEQLQKAGQEEDKEEVETF